jgi:hypothetical protein
MDDDETPTPPFADPAAEDKRITRTTLANAWTSLVKNKKEAVATA